jgi:hypothetical protein
MLKKRFPEKFAKIKSRPVRTSEQKVSPPGEALVDEPSLFALNSPYIGTADLFDEHSPHCDSPRNADSAPLGMKSVSGGST